MFVLNGLLKLYIKLELLKNIIWKTDLLHFSEYLF